LRQRYDGLVVGNRSSEFVKRRQEGSTCGLSRLAQAGLQTMHCPDGKWDQHRAKSGPFGPKEVQHLASTRSRGSCPRGSRQTRAGPPEIDHSYLLVRFVRSTPTGKRDTAPVTSAFSTWTNESYGDTGRSLAVSSHGCRTPHTRVRDVT